MCGPVGAIAFSGRADGFETADDLRREIDTLYAGQLAEGYRAFRVVFSVLAEEG